MEDMRLFDNTNNTGDIAINVQEMLDYIVLTIIENLGQDNIAFKGGYVLNQLIPEVSRLTHDVDFSVDSTERYNKVKKVLGDIGDYFITNKLIASYKIKDTIEPTISGGADFYDLNGAKILGVDVGLHQLISGTKWYDVSIGKLHSFSVERILSDKIHAIFSPKRFRRTKDLYDVYYLLENFDVDYNMFKELLEKRGTIDLNKNPFQESVLKQYQHAWEKLQVVSMYQDLILDKPDFRFVIERLGNFCFPIMNEFSRDYKIWNKKLLRWE